MLRCFLFFYFGEQMIDIRLCVCVVQQVNDTIFFGGVGVKAPSSIFYAFWLSSAK